MNFRRNTEQRLDVVLIRPATYDEDGYLVQHFRGAIPSNTLCTLYSLTESAAKEPRFAGRVRIRAHAYDETVQRVVPEKIARRLKRRSRRVLVGIVGVQTNQFPRTVDLATRFVAAGCKVMVGGFHVSGSIAMSETMPPECQALLDAGVTLVKGEVDACWGDILEDVIEDRIQPFYDITERPDLENAPLGELPPGYNQRFVSKHYATMTTSRGCPYGCTFCTVINVQGRKMRVASTEAILDRVRRNWRGGKGITWWLFTDDNLARNRNWEAIFDGLIRMREEDGVCIDFFMQVDVNAHKIPGFAEKASRAGCTQVFIGVESINPKNLEDAGKRHNKVSEYARMAEAWHEAGVHVHAAYIIGFPHDTYESVMKDVDRLAEEVKADQASFFMLTPLPGSKDHADAVAAGVPMDDDLNMYDSFHAVTDHPRMSREEWGRAYRDAWKRFYSFKNMKATLLRVSARNYWGMLKGLIWYRASVEEGYHPMLVGLFRRKRRKDRRPGMPIEPRWTHFRRRVRETFRLIRIYIRLFFEFQELWLQTRIHAERVKKQHAWRGQLKGHVKAMLANLQGAQNQLVVSVGNLREAIENNIESLRGVLPNVSIPQAGRRLHSAGRRWYRRVLEKIGALSVRGVSTRKHLDRFWLQTRRSLRRGRIWRINPAMVLWNLLRDVKVSFSFTVFMLGERLL